MSAASVPGRDPRWVSDNLEMAREILDRYERGDDRPLVMGWAVRLASHLLALTRGDEREVGAATRPDDGPTAPIIDCNQ